MKLKIHLFDGRVTLAQRLIVLLWGSLLVSVVVLWAPVGVSLVQSGTSGLFLGIAQLLGLLATFFALTQFMLMGRIFWIERAFGLDRLASYHRLNGYVALTFILLHPIFITLHRMAAEQTSIVSAYLNIFSENQYTIWALVAEIFFVVVAASSIYISRKRLKFETWYFVHLIVYLAIILASFHQFANGGSLVSSEIARTYWLGLYLFVALNLLVWRFGLLVYNFFTFRFTVSRVVHETPTVTSVYIKVYGNRHFNVKPGQFILVRIFTKELWWQEHPFTVSWIPRGDELRISVRNVGDYTAEIQKLTPGARVAVSGPFGRFTTDVAGSSKRLFIAGGIGITPLRSLAEQAASADTDAVLLYANRDSHDVPLKKEIDGLGLKTVYIYNDERVKGAQYGRIDGELIEKFVPDFRNRDIYICGPPVMMSALVEQLTSLGAMPEMLHYESFSLHSQ